MTKETIKSKVVGMNEEDAFFGLFYIILTKNGYYDNIRNFAESYDGGIDEVVADIQNCYDESTETPYSFLDSIEDYLAVHLDCTLTIGEMWDEICDKRY